ncbi:9136_t:CDS:2 [Dentiscutata erythropus]|uniref:9136_t:CDS:1 n=1 Tax=Dentiscutata erythropus TaxID=1348616 RepID=A0A9N9HNY0_9GLOM|nr:9136_t:CDS:2 [Dentiscutata erythropus]
MTNNDQKQNNDTVPQMDDGDFNKIPTISNNSVVVEDLANNNPNKSSTIVNNSMQSSLSTSSDSFNTRNNSNSEQDSSSTNDNNISNNSYNTEGANSTPENDVSKQNPESVSDNNNLDSITVNGNSSNSSTDRQDSNSTSENDVSEQNSKLSSDNDNLNTKQNSESIATNGDFDNSFEDSNPILNEQNSRFNNDNNDPYTKQGQISITGSYDSNNSSKHTQELNSTPRNDVPNNKQISKSTSGNDILKIKQANDYSKVGTIKSTKTISISILVAVIAIIFGFVFYYGSIFEIFFPPVDSPIFRNLISTTNLLSRQLAELNIPASSVIIGYRVTSKYLADIINRNKLSSKNSDKVAQYLNQLGDKLSNSGEAIEKMYLTGNYALKELESELRFINDEIFREQVITKQDAVYFANRYEKILKAITKLWDEFRITLSELDDLYDLYSGTHHQLAKGMKDVELFFDEIAPELKVYYNIEKLKRDLSYLKQIMKKVPDIRNYINNLLFEFNNHRTVLIGYRREWIVLRRRKLVSFEDTEKLEEMIHKLTNVIRIFAKKDLENTEKRIYI